MTAPFTWEAVDATVPSLCAVFRMALNPKLKAQDPHPSSNHPSSSDLQDSSSLDKIKRSPYISRLNPVFHTARKTRTTRPRLPLPPRCNPTPPLPTAAASAGRRPSGSVGQGKVCSTGYSCRITGLRERPRLSRKMRISPGAPFPMEPFDPLLSAALRRGWNAGFPGELP